MTHKSLFKEAAQRIVRLGQMPDSPSQPAGQAGVNSGSLAHGRTGQIMRSPLSSPAEPPPVGEGSRRES